ncbi:MAG: tetratricopeptide repeat protein, partial [Desulfomonilaceae bacterium]
FSNDVKLVRTFDDKINEIAHFWLDKEKYEYAISVFKLYVKVTPESWDALNSLAEAYLKNGQAELAITYFEKSLKINPDNSYVRKKIEEIKRHPFCKLDKVDFNKQSN